MNFKVNKEKKVDSKNAQLREQKRQLLAQAALLANTITSTKMNYQNEIAQLEFGIEAAEKAVETLRNELLATPECPLCHREFEMERVARTPRILSCGHTVCRLCLCSHWTNSSAICCPLDGKWTPLGRFGLSGIPINHDLIPAEKREIVFLWNHHSQ